MDTTMGQVNTLINAGLRSVIIPMSIHQGFYPQRNKAVALDSAPGFQTMSLTEQINKSGFT